MNLIRKWMSEKPWQVVLFTSWFTVTPTILAFRDDWIVGGILWFIAGLVMWVFHVSRTSITVIVAASMLAIQVPDTRAEPPPDPKQNAAIGVGVVVICVGAFCLYKVVKLCQKKFPPKSTNAPPEELFADGTEYGAAYEYSSMGSCYVPPDTRLAPGVETNPTTFTLDITASSRSISATMSANSSDNSSQTWDQFRSEMEDHGLFLRGMPSSPQFSMNGMPCDPSLVPIEFDQFTGRVIHKTGDPGLRISIERSVNLQDWHPFMSVDVSDGTRFKVVDTTLDGQMFYRVRNDPSSATRLGEGQK